MSQEDASQEDANDYFNDRYSYETIKKTVKSVYFLSLKTREEYSTEFDFEDQIICNSYMLLEYDDNFNEDTQEYYLLQEYVLADYAKCLFRDQYCSENNWRLESYYQEAAKDKLSEISQTCKEIRKAYLKKRNTEPLFDKLTIKTLECTLFSYVSEWLYNHRK